MGLKVSYEYDSGLVYLKKETVTQIEQKKDEKLFFREMQREKAADSAGTMLGGKRTSLSSDLIPEKLRRKIVGKRVHEKKKEEKAFFIEKKRLLQASGSPRWWFGQAQKGISRIE